METHIDYDVGFLFSGEFIQAITEKGILGIKPTFIFGRLYRIKLRNQIKGGASCPPPA